MILKESTPKISSYLYVIQKPYYMLGHRPESTTMGSVALQITQK